jgi:hypothetical protein
LVGNVSPLRPKTSVDQHSDGSFHRFIVSLTPNRVHFIALHFISRELP